MILDGLSKKVQSAVEMTLGRPRLQDTSFLDAVLQLETVGEMPDVC